jgi:hypothetical protein
VEVIELAMDIGALSVRGNHDHAVVKERALYVQALREMQAEIASAVSGGNSSGSSSSSSSGGGGGGVSPFGAEKTIFRGGSQVVGKDGNATPPDVSSGGNSIGRKYAKFVQDSAHHNAVSKMPQHLRVAAALTEEQASWLADLPYFIRSLDLGAVFVHAGLVNNVRLSYQEPWIMMTMRSQMPSGRASSRCLNAHPWAKTWKGPLTAYFGHDTARGLQIYPSAYGIDTGKSTRHLRCPRGEEGGECRSFADRLGSYRLHPCVRCSAFFSSLGCVYGGNLTAVLLPDQSIVSVPARQAYLKFK